MMFSTFFIVGNLTMGLHYFLRSLFVFLQRKHDLSAVSILLVYSYLFFVPSPFFEVTNLRLSGCR